MTAAAIGRLARWRLAGSSVLARAQPAVARAAPCAATLGETPRDEFFAPLAARVSRWARRQWQRLAAQREPRTAAELLAYARSIERTAPSLASELQFIVITRPTGGD